MLDTPLSLYICVQRPMCNTCVQDLWYVLINSQEQNQYFSFLTTCLHIPNLHHCYSHQCGFHYAVLHCSCFQSKRSEQDKSSETPAQQELIPFSWIARIQHSTQIHLVVNTLHPQVDPKAKKKKNVKGGCGGGEQERNK